ncbi:MAG: zinc ribbon domain-containing protein [Candidatus Omnitrophica bacterium]|jgi:putative FmdB family regulatory protein|nr:zinc ribbon domain-containing protein [Candidatus Omnitrophota bacterium]
MPTYEYECLDCGHHFEAFQKMSDLPLKQCEKCKGKVKRVISTGSGLIFKGSGFYATDYKKSRVSSSSKESPKKTADKQCDGCHHKECNQKNNKNT